MLEIVNTVACGVLMCYSLPVAMQMGNRGLWMARLSMVAVVWGLFMQVSNPWLGWFDALAWPTVYLNAASAVMLTIWWRRLWTFVCNYLGPQDSGPRRRKSDWQLQPVQHMAPRWHGGPKA